jgi:DNA-binding transcriptional regulator YiaG
MMNASDLVRTLIDKFGMTKEQIAADLGSSVRSVERWYDGDGTPLLVYRNRLHEMVNEKQGAKP